MTIEDVENEGSASRKISPGIIKGFDLGAIAFIADYDGNFSDTLADQLIEGLKPLGLKIPFFDWVDLPTNLRGFKFREGFSTAGYCYHSLHIPDFYFESNTVNVFYNCGFQNKVNQDLVKQTPISDKDAALIYLLDYFAAGTGYLQTEASDRYYQNNIHLLILISEEDLNYFWRYYTKRDGSNPYVPLFDSNS